MEHHVAIDDLATVNGEARFERLGVEERVRGLRLPEELSTSEYRRCASPGFGLMPLRTAFPVVFGGRRNPVAVVTAANLVGGLKLTKRLLDRGELGVRGDVGMKRRRNVLRGAVNTFHVLQAGR